MTSVGPESEELLDPARPLLPRRVRIALLALAAVVAAVGVAVYAWPDPSGTPQAAVSSLDGGSSAPPAHTSTPSSRHWPTARAACGSTAELPLIDGAVPVRGGTGISVLAGSTQLASVDFDAGRVIVPFGSSVLPRGYVYWRSQGNLAAAYNCRGVDRGAPKLFRVTRDGVVPVPVPLPGRTDDWLIDGDRAWSVRWSAAPHGRDLLTPVGGGRRVRLPPAFLPWGITHDLVAGNVATSGGPSPLLLVDAATGRIRQNLGDGQVLAVDDGLLVWTTGCDVTTAPSCTAHQRPIDGGNTTNYRLPRSPAVSSTAISPDHTLVAFALERAHPDPRFVNDHPFPPADLAVLNLGTGAVDVLPGVEVPAKSSAALAFTPDNWLVAALNAGSRIRLLAWRPGTPHPFEARSVPGLASSPPALVVLPRSSRITHGGTGR